MPTPNDDELTQARRGRAEVESKMIAEQDEEMVKYYQLVIAQWDRNIKQLEAKHAAREANVRTKHQPGGDENGTSLEGPGALE